jgi:hypothetical protein
MWYAKKKLRDENEETTTAETSYSRRMPILVYGIESWINKAGDLYRIQPAEAALRYTILRMKRLAWKL